MNIIRQSGCRDEREYPQLRASLNSSVHTLKARAAGYELDGARAADVTSGAEARADIQLRKARNLSAQLTNAEWMISMPGTDEQKRFRASIVKVEPLD